MINNKFDKFDVVLPNYNESVLNTISSILNYYGISNGHNTLSKLDDYLNKKYKNVVLFILDGMGEHVLNGVDNDGFFKKNQLMKLTSVYPSTTTAAMTTYYSGKSPLETGWIAWSQYFKEYGRCMNMLPRVESYSEEKLKEVSVDVFSEIIGYKSVHEKLEEKGIESYEISPGYAERKSNRTIIGDNLDEVSKGLKSLCSMPKDKFILVYMDNPDGLLHKYGVSSDEAKGFIMDAQSMLEELSRELDDTLIIISADHGHKDIGNVYSVLDYPELRECLIMPEFFESRFVGFWVKENKKDKFEEIFKREFKDYVLLTAQEILDYGLLGEGVQHSKVDDFLGNYIALSVGDSIFRLQNDYFEGKKVKKSTHCGLTKEEMEVPLIILECNHE